ncbi:MAG: hypothetical protein WDW38_006651 [Sanguina aurantia]
MSIAWDPLAANHKRALSTAVVKQVNFELQNKLPPHQWQTRRSQQFETPVRGVRLTFQANGRDLASSRSLGGVREILMCGEMLPFPSGMLWGHVTILNPNKKSYKTVHRSGDFDVPADFHTTVYHQGVDSADGQTYRFNRECSEHFNLVNVNGELMVGRVQAGKTRCEDSGNADAHRYARHLVYQFMHYLQATSSVGAEPAVNARKPFRIKEADVAWREQAGQIQEDPASTPLPASRTRASSRVKHSRADSSFTSPSRNSSRMQSRARSRGAVSHSRVQTPQDWETRTDA